MTGAILSLVAFSLAVGWIPIVWKFLRNWQARHNPISLAIAILAAFATWMAIVPYWLVGDSVSPKGVAIGIVVVNAIVLGGFYFAEWRASIRFPEARGD